MNASNEMCEELAGTYKDFRPYDKDTFVGYKLAERKGGPNYYSIVSGMFRYKPRWIKERSYSSLYEREQVHYEAHLYDKLSLFVRPEDAYDALIAYEDIANYETDLVMLEITLKKDLEKAKYSNVSVQNKDVVIGSMMDRVKEIKFKR